MSDETIIPGAGTINTEPILARFELRQGTVDEWKEAGKLDTRSGEPLLGFQNNGEIVLKIGDGTKNKTWEQLKGFSTAELMEIHKYMEEHGGSWDAIRLSSDDDKKQFKFEVNTQTLRHITQDDADSDKIASGLIYNAGDEGSDSFTGSTPDDMKVEGKSTFAAGRNIQIGANYASALGTSHINNGYASFAAGNGNILTKLDDSELDGKTNNKNSRYAAAIGSTVMTVGHSSFSAGYGCKQKNFVTGLSINTSNQAVYDKWKGYGDSQKPAIAYGNFSARFGQYNIAIGTGSFTAGSWTAAIGNGSVAFGGKTIASGDYSFVCGSNNTVGAYGFSAGVSNVVKSTETGVAIGQSNYLGGGLYNFAAGCKNQTSANGAILLGSGLKTYAPNSLTIGQFNENKSNAIFIVGNGTGNVTDIELNAETGLSDKASIKRNNAFVVYTDGHAEIAYVNPKVEASVPTVQWTRTEISNFDFSNNKTISDIQSAIDDINNLNINDRLNALEVSTGVVELYGTSIRLTPGKEISIAQAIGNVDDYVKNVVESQAVNAGTAIEQHKDDSSIHFKIHYDSNEPDSALGKIGDIYIQIAPEGV